MKRAFGVVGGPRDGGTVWVDTPVPERWVYVLPPRITGIAVPGEEPVHPTYCYRLIRCPDCGAGRYVLDELLGRGGGL